MCAAHHPSRQPPTIDDIHRRVGERLGRDEQRYTQGRRRLVELLAGAGRPLTLPQLLDLDTDLSQSSAYRNLDVLERTGLVQKVVLGGEYAHYELAEPLLGHHHHLICVDCGTVEDVRLDDGFEIELEQALDAVASAVGFDVLHHSLDLHGRCSSCGDGG